MTNYNKLLLLVTGEVSPENEEERKIYELYNLVSRDVDFIAHGIQDDAAFRADVIGCIYSYVQVYKKFDLDVMVKLLCVFLHDLGAKYDIYYSKVRKVRNI